MPTSAPARGSRRPSSRMIRPRELTSTSLFPGWPRNDRSWIASIPRLPVSSRDSMRKGLLRRSRSDTADT